MRETRFKDTEIGLIPEDWEVKKIGDFCDVKTGPFGSVLHSSDYVLTGTPIITVEHLGMPFIDVKNGVPMVSDKDKFRLSAYSLKTGDLVFSRVGSVDRNCIVTEKEDGWLFSGRLLRVRPNSTVYTPYLSYHLYTEQAKNRVLSVAVGLAMPSINTKILSGICVAIPLLKNEQVAIASALSDVDVLLRELGELIAKKKAIKMGMMQELLTVEAVPGKEGAFRPKRRLEGFEGDWVEKRIGDIFNVTRGYVLAVSKMSGFQSDYNPYPVFSSQTTNKGIAGYYNSFLFENCITWTTDGANAGDVNFRKGKFYCTNVCGVLQSEDGFANQCIASILSLCSKLYVSYVGNPKLMNNTMADIRIVIPPTVGEQTAIAEVLSDMDVEIAALEAKRAKYEQVKNGMMQELLTGRIRLV